LIESDSGAYANQPKLAAPSGLRKPAHTMRPPNRYSQNENMFSRGKATSGAPIWSGMIALANAANIGVAKSSSMIEPCIVKNWLNDSYCRNWMPGKASSARIARASTPPKRKKANAVMKYIFAITLWSVDVITL
jgi:hypothetical protein